MAEMPEKKLTGFALHPEHINRKGRPKKGESMTDVLRKYAEKRVDIPDADPDEKRRRMKRKEALARKIWRLALIKGEDWAIRYIYNRLDGLPRRSLDLAFPGGANFGVLLAPGTMDMDTWNQLAEQFKQQQQTQEE
jgi:hypothetical protein